MSVCESLPNRNLSFYNFGAGVHNDADRRLASKTINLKAIAEPKVSNGIPCARASIGYDTSMRTGKPKTLECVPFRECDVISDLISNALIKASDSPRIDDFKI